MNDLRGKLAGSEGYAVRLLSEVRYIVVHHSGVAGDATAMGIARWHVEHYGWPGIGYHFLVHEDGGIDYVGDLSTVRYNVAGRNREVVGICIPGDFTKQAPNELQLGATRNLVSVLRPVLDPDETGRVKLVGHRDVALLGYGTICPGETWRGWIGTIAEGMVWPG
ncbi:MAG: peptidoglycan recognition protein family protein [Bacteroidetes bacterium]|nr:peptidoglycan recognition protein family protein [Bacteroidota bacterium]